MTEMVYKTIEALIALAALSIFALPLYIAIIAAVTGLFAPPKD